MENYECTVDAGGNLVTERQERFVNLWHQVCAELQSPMLDNGSELIGFTGHRAVDLIDTGDPFAIGFQAHGRAERIIDAADRKTITAVWRRIYPENTILTDYESGEYSLNIADIDHDPETLNYLEELYGLFKNAPAYE